jgi:hypothetical protein
MSHRSCRPGPGSSPPAKDARPTRPTHTRSRWSGPGRADCDQSSTTNNSPFSGSWSTADERWGRTTPGKTSQLHQLLLGLIPGRGKRDLSSAQAKALLATVWPRDIAGKTRRRVAASSSRTWRRSMPAGKPRTRNSPNWSPRPAPPCSISTASDPPELPASWSRSATSPGSRTMRTARPGTAPHPSTPPPATTSATGCHEEATGRSTGSCTPWPEFNYASQHLGASTTTARKPTAKRRWKPCAASSAGCPTSCSRPCSTTPPHQAPGQAREDNGETTLTPARPAHIREPALRTSHFPDMPPPSLEPHYRPRLDTEGCQIRAAVFQPGDDVAQDLTREPRVVARQPEAPPRGAT